MLCQPELFTPTLLRYMLRRHILQLLLLLALLARTFANFTSVTPVTPNPQVQQPLRVAFAPHPFLSHWAVSAPIAHELLSRGHKVLVRLNHCLVSEHSMLQFALEIALMCLHMFTSACWQTQHLAVLDSMSHLHV